MIRAIALDDEPLALDVITTMVAGYDFIELEKTFTRPSEALKYLQENSVDLIFLDIRMPDISGTEFAASLDDRNCMVVFTTAYDDYAVESYDLNALDYLMKPISKARFDQSMKKVREYFEMSRQRSTTENYITIRADFSTIRLSVEDILYVEGMADYLRIFVRDRKPIVTRMTVKGMLEALPEEQFMRVHRSFIIPLHRILAVKSKTIVLPEREIPVGNTYLNKVATLAG